MLYGLNLLFWIWFASVFALFATHAVVKGKWFAAPLWFLGYFAVSYCALGIALATIFPHQYHLLRQEFLDGVSDALYLGPILSTIVVAICAFVLRKKLLQE